MLDLGINMINGFLKNNINLGTTFMARTGRIMKVFATDIAMVDFSECDGFYDAGIMGNGVVLILTLAVTAWLT